MANTTVVVARAKTFPLSTQEGAYSECTLKYHVDYGDIAYGTGSSDTVTLTLGATPANWAVTNSRVNVTTAFAGTTALTIQVGTTTTTNAFVTALSVLTAGLLQGSQTLANATGTATITMQALFTNATGGSPSALSAGALDIYLNLLRTDTSLG